MYPWRIRAGRKVQAARLDALLQEAQDGDISSGNILHELEKRRRRARR